ncbi:MAG: agmatine deiminase [Desulfuromonas sp.]|nr:MAG: agmatine deiminase [Desulfuromonas sp.]
MSRRLPAEWEEQDGVLLSWPHADSDWCDDLERVEPVFFEIALQISRFERVIIVAPDAEALTPRLRAAGIDSARLSVVALPSNDTWSRDFGPIAIEADGALKLLDFGFNGWGLKFASDRDNQISRHLAAAGRFAAPLQTVGLILEGGSLESDGAGTLLTTAECLLNANRNPHLTREKIVAEMASLFGVSHQLWLENGYLAGDDTDSHIDTLARICPNDTIAYVACDNVEDEHYPALSAMAQELRAFRTPSGAPYRLLALPWPQACFDDEGERLPATYANFLIINDAVLVPTYADPQDATALAVIAEAFPGREIIGIDCRPLIRQHGSLHCVTMQLPLGVLA